jgi:hypothetical protein
MRTHLLLPTLQGQKAKIAVLVNKKEIKILMITQLATQQKKKVRLKIKLRVIRKKPVQASLKFVTTKRKLATQAHLLKTKNCSVKHKKSKTKTRLRLILK